MALQHRGVVALHAGRIHRELDSGASVVVGVDDDLELILKSVNKRKENRVRTTINKNQKLWL